MANKNYAMCCFCGERLDFDTAVQIQITPSQVSRESQVVYCHRECIDKVLHKDVPRHPYLSQDE